MSKLTEIRWHGRGGQGAVTSAEVMGLSAIEEGKFAQAFPSFGPERRGAPVLAFNRISDSEHIRMRSAVTQPDIVVVLDPGLLGIIDVTRGLKEGGVLIINSSKSLLDIKSEFEGPWTLAVVDATAIAMEVLKIPIVNTAMLGAMVKVTGVVKLESLAEPLGERFGKLAEKNIAACRRAYDEVSIAAQGAVSQRPEKTFGEVTWPSWQELLPGGVVTDAGNARSYRTGDWRSDRPIWDHDRCIKCGVCMLFCPEGCVEQNEQGYFEANYYYCKGCGICARECWTQAITMVEEAKA
ncbi:MAG: 2-oxoacid:acceptor oxidoreductase family protein [Dehalococcoidia bacterium]|nr:2-oxoacid:acceptor oxidoreductase family protein [Dehalococcoidia bacterium]